MRRLRRAAALVAFCATALPVRAQFISVSGSPSTLIVSSAVAGSPLNPASDASTSYFLIVLTGTAQKISAQLNSPMPAGVTLAATLAAPPGATSLGPVALDASARTVVTGIGLTIASRAISYQLTATPAAGVVPLQSRTVTLTVSAAP